MGVATDAGFVRWGLVGGIVSRDLELTSSMNRTFLDFSLKWSLSTVAHCSQSLALCLSLSVNLRLFHLEKWTMYRFRHSAESWKFILQWE